MELETPGSAVRHASVARHVTDCATRPGMASYLVLLNVPYHKECHNIWFRGMDLNGFDFILYVTVNSFSVMPGQVFLDLTNTKQGLIYHAQGQNSVLPKRLQPATLLLRYVLYH